LSTNSENSGKKTRQRTRYDAIHLLQVGEVLRAAHGLTLCTLRELSDFNM